MPRPSKLTPERQNIIVGHVRNGGYLSVAAQLAGVDEGTVHRWLAKGSETGADKIYREFREAVREAEGDLERLVLEKARDLLDKAEAPDVRLGLEVLSRRHPDRWAPPKVRADVSVTGADGGPIAHEVTVTARKQLLDALDGMGKRIRGQDDDEGE